MRTRELQPSVWEARRSLKRFITAFFNLGDGWPLNMILRADPGTGKTYALIEGLGLWLEIDPDGTGLVVVAVNSRKLAIQLFRDAAERLGIKSVAIMLGRARPNISTGFIDPENTCIHPAASKLARSGKDAGHLCRKCPCRDSCAGPKVVENVEQVLGAGLLGMRARAFSGGIRVIVTTRQLLAFIEEELGDNQVARILDDAPPDRDAYELGADQIEQAVEHLLPVELGEDAGDPVSLYLTLLQDDLRAARIAYSRGLKTQQSPRRAALRDYGIRVPLSGATVEACTKDVLQALDVLTKAQGEEDPVLPRSILALAKAGDDAWIAVGMNKRKAKRERKPIASLHAAEEPLPWKHTLILDGTASVPEYTHSLRGPLPKARQIRLRAPSLHTIWNPSSSWQPSALRGLYRDVRREHPAASFQEVRSIVEEAVRQRLRRTLLRLMPHLLWVADAWIEAGRTPKLYIVAHKTTLREHHPSAWDWLERELVQMGFTVKLDHWRSTEGRGLNALKDYAGLLMFGSPRPSYGALAAYLEVENWCAESCQSAEEMARRIVGDILDEKTRLDPEVIKRGKDDAIAIMDQTAGRPRFPLVENDLPRLLAGCLPEATPRESPPRLEEGPYLMTNPRPRCILPRDQGAHLKPSRWSDMLDHLIANDLRSLSPGTVAKALDVVGSRARALVASWRKAGLLAGGQWKVHTEGAGRAQTWTALHQGVTAERIQRDAEGQGVGVVRVVPVCRLRSGLVQVQSSRTRCEHIRANRSFHTSS